MKVYVNNKNEIKDVNTTEDATLTPIEVPNGFFDGWAVAKICCFKVILEKGKIVGYTPYVDSKIIEHIERLAKENEANSSDIGDIAMAILELYER